MRPRVDPLAPRLGLTLNPKPEQRRPPGSKRCETKVRMVWGSFLISIAALQPPTRNGYNAQGVNLGLKVPCAPQ